MLRGSCSRMTLTAVQTIWKWMWRINSGNLGFCQRQFLQQKETHHYSFSMPNSEDIRTYTQTPSLNLCEMFWTKHLELWLIRNHKLIYSTTDNSFIYSIADNFKMLSVVQNIQHQMVEEPGNNKLARSQKETVTSQLLVLSWNLPAGCEKSQSPDWDLKPRPPKYKAEILASQQQCAVSHWHTIPSLPPGDNCM